MAFADIMKKERAKLQMTQADFAKHIGVSHRSLQNYELGLNHPRSRDAYQKIADALENGKGTSSRYSDLWLLIRRLSVRRNSISCFSAPEP